jgi:hypothetical protein
MAYQLRVTYLEANPPVTRVSGSYATVAEAEAAKVELERSPEHMAVDVVYPADTVSPEERL